MDKRRNRDQTYRRVGTGRMRPNSGNGFDLTQSYGRNRNHERRNNRNEPNDRGFQPIDSNRNGNNSNENLLQN